LGIGKPTLALDALLRRTPTHHISGGNALGLRSLQSVSPPSSHTTLIAKCYPSCRLSWDTVATQTAASRS